MNRSTISACHSLKIIPLSALTLFARIRSDVLMKYTGLPIDLKAVPGTIKVSSSASDGKIIKKITFERSDVSGTVSSMLEVYKSLHLIATYIDESGRTRVSGSPEWPLTLDYTTEGGVFNVTLQGEDMRQDGFLAD